MLDVCQDRYRKKRGVFFRRIGICRAAVSFLSLPASDAGPASGRAEEADALAVRLLKEYGNSLLRFAYAYVHNMSDAEELLQDTLMQYLQAAPAVQSPEHERAWLFHTAANLCKNRIRYNRLRQTDELSESLAAAEEEDLSFVWDAVRSLPKQYREVMHLYYYEGYRTAEIAEILGRRESTVRSDLRRGRERLKSILKEGFDFEETL